MSVAVMLLALASPHALADDSAVRFTAHQTFSNTTGHFRKFEGTFDIDREDLAASKVRVEIDAASIDTDNDGRDDHLRNEDFFHVDEHPKIVFESTSVTPTAKDRVRVKGTLTVKGKKVPVTFSMQLKWRDDGVDAFGRLTVDRNTLGLTYEAPFYAPALKPNVNLELDVKLRRRGG